MTTIALADDHQIFCDSLKALINDFEGFEVIWTALDGEQTIERLKDNQQLPKILLLDINMPGKSGIEVAEWVFTNNKPVDILALTTEEDDDSILKMLRYNVKGYLLKKDSGEKLHNALEAVVQYGFYYTPLITRQISERIAQKNKNQVPELKEREKQLLQYMCSDLSYAEIAAKMFLSESTVDTYRARLFEKFEVKSRVGLLLKANSMGLVKL